MEEVETVKEESAANTLFTPFKLLSWMLSSMLGHLATTIIRLQIHTLWNQDLAYAYAYQDNYQYDNDHDYYNDDNEEIYSDDSEEVYLTQDVSDKQCVDDVFKEFAIKDKKKDELVNGNTMKAKPCDKELNLYELNEGALTSDNWKPLKGILRNCGRCER